MNEYHFFYYKFCKFDKLSSDQLYFKNERLRNRSSWCWRSSVHSATWRRFEWFFQTDAVQGQRFRSHRKQLRKNTQTLTTAKAQTPVQKLSRTSRRANIKVALKLLKGHPRLEVAYTALLSAYNLRQSSILVRGIIHFYIHVGKLLHAKKQLY